MAGVLAGWLLIAAGMCLIGGGLCYSIEASTYLRGLFVLVPSVAGAFVLVIAGSVFITA